MSRPAVVLKKPISRDVSANGVRLIVTITPDGFISARAKFRRTHYRTNLAEVFSHCVAEKGGSPFEQLGFESFVTPAKPIADPDAYTRRSDSLPVTESQGGNES